MIIEELVVQNFGVYHGHHVVVLAPPSSSQPVVLFGGLNGGGKTTLLDAVQLALYGKLARCSKRGSRSYTDFLRSCIHKTVSPHDGALIELTLSTFKDGTHHRYRIRRLWADYGSGIRETVAVHVDDRKDPDPVLSEQWLEFMEELLPNRLAHLFFFDGERIEALASPDESAELLRTAIHSLLGLDVVDQLTTDLKALERRKTVANLEATDRKAIDDLDLRLKDSIAAREQLRQQRAARQSERDRTIVKLQRAEKTFEREGGHLFEQGVALEKERERIFAELQNIEEEMREFTHEITPLFLVDDLIGRTLEQAYCEQHAAEAYLLTSLLLERDKQVLDVLARHEVDADAFLAVEKLLDANRQHHHDKARVPSYLHLDRDTVAQLAATQNGLRDQVFARRRQLLSRHDELTQRLDDQDRRIASIPAKETIAPLLAERDQLRRRHIELELELARLDGDIRVAVAEAERASQRLQGALERYARDHFEYEEAARILSHSERARATLTAFRQQVLERHIARVERLILESFQALLRKQTLVDTLRIDPTTFRVTLAIGDQPLLAEHLSAGERQLLAISMLWGLGKAAGRDLPIIIDTPMGRLDSQHRQHLVDRYFPHASHQIILLSTDEEINANHLERLGPWIGRAYCLEYDEAQRGTVVQPGYFWDRNDEPDRDHPVVAGRQGPPHQAEAIHRTQAVERPL